MDIQKINTYIKNTLGSEDRYKFYNPLTGRQIKKISDKSKIVIYGCNERLGYQSMVLFEQIPNNPELTILNEVFDQQENIKFNDLWDLIINS